MKKKETTELEARLNGAISSDSPDTWAKIQQTASATASEPGVTVFRKKRFPVWRAVAGLAACLALTVTAVYALPALSRGNSEEAMSPQATAENSLPETTGATTWASTTAFASTRAEVYTTTAVGTWATTVPCMDFTSPGYEDKPSVDYTATAVPGTADIAPTGALTGDPPSTTALTFPFTEATVPPVVPQAGLLTAAEWDDNSDGGAFLRTLLSGQGGNGYRYNSEWLLDPSRSFAVKVLSAAGEPLSGAKVTLSDGNGNAIFTSVTRYDGMSYLYYSLLAPENPATVTAELNGISASAEYTGTALELTLDAAGAPKTLDLMFTIDTTGSMGDELTYIQAELADVISKIRTGNPNTAIRLALNFYRDEGDEYVTRSFDFTTDINAALENLAAQIAVDGGDEPEAVHTALDVSLNKCSWSEDSVKLMFFVLDAPPHSEAELPGTPAAMAELIQAASAQGVRIIPVVSSGASTSTEAVMRISAALTGGVYTFLTDDSGIGVASGHAIPTIGPYEVKPLNELLISIANRYLG